MIIKQSLKQNQTITIKQNLNKTKQWVKNKILTKLKKNNVESTLATFPGKLFNKRKTNNFQNMNTKIKQENLE